jgi:hypothetical protein
LSSASRSDCLAKSILSTLFKSQHATENLPDILKWNQFSTLKAKEWFQANMKNIIRPTAQSGLSSPAPLSHAPPLVSPQPRVYRNTSYDNDDSDDEPPLKRAKCDPWTKAEMEQLADYYRKGKYDSRGNSTAEKIKLSDDTNSSRAKILSRFTLEQIAVSTVSTLEALSLLKKLAR